jgi:hypothetical protein
VKIDIKDWWLIRYSLDWYSRFSSNSEYQLHCQFPFMYMSSNITSTIIISLTVSWKRTVFYLWYSSTSFSGIWGFWCFSRAYRRGKWYLLFTRQLYNSSLLLWITPYPIWTSTFDMFWSYFIFWSLFYLSSAFWFDMIWFDLLCSVLLFFFFLFWPFDTCEMWTV